MPARQILPFIFFLSACSSIPMFDRYKPLDGESKAVFLYYYPDLKPGERDDLLGIASTSKARMALFKNLDEDPITFFPKIMKQKKSYTITSMELKSEVHFPVRDGHKAEFSAWVEYADGRKAEATKDVLWSVLPHLANFNESTLQFECASSDVIITANFLDERETSLVVPIRKAIDYLDLSVSEPNQDIEESVFIRLKVVAHCKDGSTSDVSCEANWDTDSKFGEMLGCGNFHVLKKDLSSGQIASVRAHYGDKTVTKSISLPERHASFGTAPASLP